MSGKIKKMNFWVRRKSHILLILVFGAVVGVLFLNDDTSVELNMQYQEEINSLKRQIRQCNDSAEYYRARREALITGTEELEQIAREQYNMQKPSEDVFVITKKK